jgi:hypothetical protein
MLQNRALRRLFGPQREEVVGGWRLHNLYTSPNVIRKIKLMRIRWVGQVSRLGEMRNTYKILVGEPGGKRTFGRPKHRGEDNIKMYLREIVVCCRWRPTCITNRLRCVYALHFTLKVMGKKRRK